MLAKMWTRMKIIIAKKGKKFNKRPNKDKKIAIWSKVGGSIR